MRNTIEWTARATEPGRPACTFLVPARLVKYLRRRKKRHKGVVRYLGHLLRLAPSYRRAGLLPNVQRTTRYYQRSGQALDPWHVRVPAHHWTELRCLAGSCGVTMTHMFSILMDIEKSGKFKPRGEAPTSFWKNIGFWEARRETDLVTERHVILVTQAKPP